MRARKAAPLAHLVLELLTHIAVGIVIFSVIALGAVFLDQFIQFITEGGSNIIIAYTLKSAEFLLLIGDLYLFGRFIWWAIGDFCSKLPDNGNKT